MSVYTGKDAKLAFGTDTILYLVSYDFSLNSPLVEVETFGDEYMNVVGQGIKSSGGSLSGLMDTSDTTGQVAIENACVSGTKITDFRLYVNDTEYWASDTVNDTDSGVYFTDFTVGAPEPSGAITMGATFKFSGQVHKTS